jgi:hypothetical protein
MKMFHIDMNGLHYRRPYLEAWLGRLAALGYDTILWEVENGVRWETCPESAAPDAFGKEEFAAILATARRLGLAAVPLLQTLAHCEYVLRHPRYAELSEEPGRETQYCPLHPGLMPFLHRWIEEYLDVFGQVGLFHVGADEAWTLGTCPACRDHVARHSRSRLFIEHVKAVTAPLRRRGIVPAIWADMILTHPEALDRLPRGVVLFDWHYEIRRGMPEIQVWGPGMTLARDLSAETRARFGPWLYPHGDEPGRDPDPFFNAAYLRDQGFRVVGCSGSSSYGDNVFAPRHWLHVVNSADWVRTVADARLAGYLQTSWSVHLFPWELQLPAIAVPAFLSEDADASLATYPDWFAACFLGLGSGQRFWAACGLLSKPCLFSQTAQLGFGKAMRPTPRGWFSQRLGEIVGQGQVKTELGTCRERLADYRRAARLFAGLRPGTAQGKALLEDWILAADTLAHRAELGLHLLRHADTLADPRRPLPAAMARRLVHLRAGMRELRDRHAAMLRVRIKPQRRRQILGWMFDALDRELAGALARKTRPASRRAECTGT